MKQAILFFLMGSLLFSPKIAFSESTTPASNLRKTSPPQHSTRLNLVQIDKIKTTGLKIVGPKVIPQGYWLDEIDTYIGNDKGYVIVYRNSKNQCFAIEGTSGGIGDLPDTYHAETKVLNPIFGRVSLYLKYEKENSLITTWMKASEKGPYYHLIEATNLRSDDYKNLKNLSFCKIPQRDEMLKIVESLDYLE